MNNRPLIAKLVDGKIQIDPQECNKCGRCKGKCPFGAVEEYQDGFRIYIGGRWGKRVAHGVPLTTIFTSEEEVLERQAEFTTGENAPVGISEGKRYWKITLEELIPAGNGEVADPVEPFELRIESDAVLETYYHCKWTSIERSFTKEGLRRVRKGISMLRQVEE